MDPTRAERLTNTLNFVLSNFLEKFFNNKAGPIALIVIISIIDFCLTTLIVFSGPISVVCKTPIALIIKLKEPSIDSENFNIFSSSEISNPLKDRLNFITFSIPSLFSKNLLNAKPIPPLAPNIKALPLYSYMTI